MGRALAMSKLESIKDEMNGLATNLAEESGVVKNTVDQMLQKHQLTELDVNMVQNLEEKKREIIAQIPKINKLETALDVQEEDPELVSIKSKIEKNVSDARSHLDEGNRQIAAKVGAIPDAAKVLTEKQYEDQMSFVLKH